MSVSWLHIAIIYFFVLGIVFFAVVPFLLSHLLAPKTKAENLRMPYECGMIPHGSAWVKFGINYYFYALIFLAFDVDVLFLFPVATYYVEAPDLVSFIKLLIFIVILFASVIYFWKKGVFTWPKKIKP
ncbi:NADH-quinone oxidoreductase subunit A [Desulfonatronospira sp.]|uniref:NADH-quinone oxidoreductase subunit A n=1 Tax=Desulfonatronospira sp. TaxID=1962951 RepID=UPI0025BE243B|nr:NADH-quinone oxidoreductase subunit A [Desulfonatronospira sp.]